MRSAAAVLGGMAAWNEWVERANPPARACVGAPLYRAGLPVEIMVTAAR